MEQSHSGQFLSVSEEHNLIRVSQADGRRAQRAKIALVRAYNPALERSVADFIGSHSGVNDELRLDLKQAAVLGFLLALRRFDVTRGARLFTYARFYVIKELTTAFVQSHDDPESKLLYGLEQETAYDSDPLDQLESEECHESVAFFMQQLTSRQQALLWLMFWRGLSLGMAARELGVSKSTTADSWRHIKIRARQALRQAA